MWLGRGERQDENAWSLNYLDKKTNEYYGVRLHAPFVCLHASNSCITRSLQQRQALSHSEHTWKPLPNAEEPGSMYYNVLEHWSAPDPMAPQHEVLVNTSSWHL